MKRSLGLPLLFLMACSTTPEGGAKVSLPASAAAPVPLGRPNADQAEAVQDAVADASSTVLTGTTVARRRSEVSASGSGLLMDLKVREGDFVEAGDVIAQLDRRDAQLRVQQAEASVKMAQVQLAGAQREFERLERLAKDQATTGAELDRVTSTRDAAHAGLEAAQAALALARKANADADVRAPYSGLVVARLKGEGEWISTMPPAPLVVLTEMDPMELRVEVPAALLSRLKVGDALTVRLPALERTLTTLITRRVPQVSAQTRTFSVFAEIPNEDRSLAAGLFAEVRLAGASPSAAVEKGANP